MDPLSFVRVVACPLLFLGFFTASSGEPVSHLIAYSQDQLLALINSMVLPEERPEIPKKIQRQRR